ncbi:unnamed protein product [Ilex paraguariensis]|uniref:Uncharacterized protein n=1 Tax=Ilex paraguariensis TaxID=185542 RepID=A0ABC8RIK5_9AQUA
MAQKSVRALIGLVEAGPGGVKSVDPRLNTTRPSEEKCVRRQLRQEKNRIEYGDEAKKSSEDAWEEEDEAEPHHQLHLLMKDKEEEDEAEPHHQLHLLMKDKEVDIFDGQ